MKIAFLIQDITTAGGTERTTCCLAKQLALHGDDVSIVSVFHNCEHPAFSAGESVKVQYLTDEIYDGNMSYARRLIRCLTLRNVIVKNETLRSADVVICQKIFASLLAYWCGLGDKSIACEHFRYKMYNGAIRFLRNRLYNKLKALVVLTEADKRQFLSGGVRNVVCIPNMVSVEPVAYVGSDSKIIVSVGRLTPQKGYDMLLQAVSLIADRMGNYCVEIYGEGEQRSELESIRKQLGIEKYIRFCGYESDISGVYSKSLFYVMSSRFEGFPMVILEAAACRLPIVSFDCPEGPRILLKDGGGIVVEKDNVRALADAMLKMIEDKEFREKCRQQTRQIIQPYLPESITALWKTFLLTSLRS